MSASNWYDRLFGGKDDKHTPVPPDNLFGHTYNADADASAAATREQEIQAMDAVLDQLTSMELPDAIDMIMLDPTMSEDAQPGCGFARYAARLFADVGASRIRQIAATNDLSVIRLSNTGMFWMRFPYGELEDDDLSYVFAAEAAMNRLLFVRNLASRSNRPVWTEGDCFVADYHHIETIGEGACELVKGAHHNPLLELYGTEGAKGGEWDVRTRFVLAAEQLRVPFRLAYTFNCNVAEGLMSIDYALPLALWMPQRAFDGQTQTWVDIAAQAPQQAARYGVALGTLLASIAFGTSVGIRRVHLVGHVRDLDGETALSLYVDRLPFVSRIMALINTHDPRWMQMFLELAATEDAAFDHAVRAMYHELVDDARPVPADLRDALCADTVAELDVLSDLPTDSWDLVHAADADRAEAPLAAIALLEDVVAQADEQASRAPEGTDVLYCSDAVSRFLLPLAGVAPDKRFVRYSDSGFRARSLLCDLYCDMDDTDRALAQAQKCIEIAPTSPIGYTDMANVLFASHRHQDAIPYLTTALGIATQESTIAFLYYRLAFAFWQSGQPDVGLACYVLCAANNFIRSDAVTEEMTDLLMDMGNPDVPAPAQARDVLQRAGVPIAPTVQVRQAISRALVRLVDSGIFEVAGPLARTVGITINHRDELFALATSLR